MEERMTGRSRLGMPIAVLFVVLAIGYWFYGGGSEGWFVRTAQQNAVRCLSRSPCTFLTAEGKIVPAARPPLASGDACADTKNWRQLKPVSNGRTPIVLTCTGAGTYLYHLGKLAGRDAGNEQWMRCADSSCAAEAKQFAVK